MSRQTVFRGILAARYRLMLLLPLIMGLSACDGDSTGPDVNNSDFEATRAFRFAVAAGARTKLALEGITGSVQIDGAAELDSVVIAGQRRVRSESMADAEAHLGDLQVVVTQPGTRVDVKTEQPSDTHGRQYIVDYEILVPSSWEVSASNVTGNIEVTSGGNTLHLECTTGRVSVDGCTGDVDVGLVTGDVRLDGVHGNVDVTTVTGNVTAEVYLPEGGDCDIGVVTGAITLAIPRTTSAAFSANVITGLVTLTDLTLNDASIGSTSVTGTLGDGHGRIDLDVTTGTISVDGF